MELIKNLLKYLIILLCLVVGAVSIMAGVLFLVPNARIFNFRYVANHNSNVVNYANMNLTKVNIETNNYDIVVMPNSLQGVDTNSSFKLIIKNNYTGFANNINQTLIEKLSGSEDKEYLNIQDFKEANFSAFKNGTELTLKLIEPMGLVSYGSSKVIVYMPENLTGVEYNLATNKGDIIFAKNSNKSSQKISTSNITINVKSAKGSFNLDNTKMENGSSLFISNYIGKVNINSENIGNVIINSNSGNFTFKNIGYDGFNGGNLTISGNNPYVRVDTVYGKVDFKTTTGFLQVKNIRDVLIAETQNGIIRIDKALGGLQISNNSGETTINQIGSDVLSKKSTTIISKSGTIKLGGDEQSAAKGVYALDKITAQSSKVIVNNLYAETSEIETTKGSVLVNFALTDQAKDLKVYTVSGAITLNNVYGTIDAKTQKSSKISANYAKFVLGSTSSFETDEGIIELTLPAPTNDIQKQYNLNLKTRVNKVDVNVGGFNLTSFASEKDNEGFYNFTEVFPEDVQTTTTLNLKTNNGKLIVKE